MRWFYIILGELTEELIRCSRSSLPILAQPEFIRKALTAGKHVLSEKPIAKDLSAAQDLINLHNSRIVSSKTVWAVAENWRYMSKFVRTAEEVRRLGGVKNFRVVMRSMIKPGSKYHSMCLFPFYWVSMEGWDWWANVYEQKRNGVGNPSTRVGLFWTVVSMLLLRCG